MNKKIKNKKKDKTQKGFQILLPSRAHLDRRLCGERERLLRRSRSRDRERSRSLSLRLRSRSREDERERRLSAKQNQLTRRTMITKIRPLGHRPRIKALPIHHSALDRVQQKTFLDLPHDKELIMRQYKEFKKLSKQKHIELAQRLTQCGRTQQSFRLGEKHKNKNHYMYLGAVSAFCC